MSRVLPIDRIQDTILYQALLTRNEQESKALVANLPALCQEANDRAKILNTNFPEYTLHDATHFLRVTQLMALVLDQTLDELNDVEIALLILAAFFHDQGMVISRTEKENLLESEAFIIFKDNWYLDHPNYEETKRQLDKPGISKKEYARLFKITSSLESAALTDYLRINHGQRSHDYILASYDQDKRLEIGGVNLSEILATICLSHVQETEWIRNNSKLHTDGNIGIYKINAIFLSLVLRLADILDFDADRTPEVLFKSIHFTSPVSVQEWQKHRSVQGWEITPSMIRFTMNFEHPVYEKCARDFLDWIDRELTAAHNLVRDFPAQASRYQLNIPERTNKDRITARNNSYIFHDLEFSLSRDEVVKLLMTNNLYKSPSLFIRELLQNSLDALRLRKANFQKDGLSWEQGKVNFRHYIDDNDDHIISCTDNGCGMDIDVVTRFFGKAGRSYYRSPEFQRYRLSLKDKGVDFEPCSQFGIGFMSCFMIGDRIEVETRKDYGVGKAAGKPLKIEINGLGGLIVIREGTPEQAIGTSIRVYSREKPLIYDDWSDNIRLLTVLKGYALANEFPIEAFCDIEFIHDSISLPGEIDKKTTFLEEFGLTQIKTLEVNLQTIHPDLSGFLRQSFLVDAAGQFCIENDEAKWDIAGDEDLKDKPLKAAIINKKTGELQVLERHSREDKSICLDGILICGSPGRHFHGRYEMSMLGWRNTFVYSEHAYLVDVRGSIKPEITPAREPADREGVFSLPPGWRRLQYLLDLGSGDLWKEVLIQCPPALFWTLLIIYRGDVHEIPSKTLMQHLSLPRPDGSWIKLSEIDSIMLNPSRTQVFDEQHASFDIGFTEDIKRFNVNSGSTAPTDWNYWFQRWLVGISKLQLLNGTILLKIAKSFADGHRPIDSKARGYQGSISCIEFIGLSNDYIQTTDFPDILNKDNPLVALGFRNYLDPSKDNLDEFAATLIIAIPQFIAGLKDDKQKIGLTYKGRALKILGAKYLRINWAHYDDQMKPPYKIYVNEDTTLEITDSVLTKWGKVDLKPKNKEKG